MPINMILSKDGTLVPIKVYADSLDELSTEQLYDAARVPGVFKHVASMPDVHAGYGIPVGSILATKGTIVPAAVGVDIGCGMIAQRFLCRAEEIRPHLEQLFETIKRKIPVSFSGRKNIPAEYDSFYQGSLLECPHTNNLAEAIEDKAPGKFGTLGGGNHFIELCGDEEGFVWVVLHSGSRNIGNRIGTHYSKLAKELNERWHSQCPRTLAFLPVDSQEGQDYIADMLWAQSYANGNRELMMKDITDVIRDVSGVECDNSSRVNIHHNYAVIENHFGENVWVHRKGATPARKGQFGVIPGSMKSGSYIVRGLGNPESFKSCSHGAGRIMSRTQARSSISLSDFQKEMAGIVSDVGEKLLDEAPQAYKSLDKVMENQSDLVEVVHRLRPMLNIKGA